MRAVAIIGSRGWPDPEAVRRWIALNINPREDVVITGGATGVDTIAEQYCSKLGIHTAVCNALWPVYYKKAGPLRNRAMLSLAEEVVAFWDGESPGTRDMIEATRRAGKPLCIFIWDRINQDTVRYNVV